MAIETSSLQDFEGWGSSDPQEDLFSEPIETGETVVEQLDEKEETEQITEAPAKEEEPTGADLFSQEEENIVEEKKEETPAQEERVEANIVKTLHDFGLIEQEDEEVDLDNLSEEEARDYVEDKWEASLENRVEELFQDLPPIVKQMNKYVLAGGDIDAFLGKIAQSNKVDVLNLDPEKELDQEQIVKAARVAQGESEEAAETYVEYLKDSGKLESIAKQDYDKIKEKKDKEKEALLEEQKKAQIEEKKLLRETKRNLSTTLKDLEDVEGIKITSKDRKELPSYMTDRTVKLTNGNHISQLQKDLYYDLFNNQEALLQLAVLMRNRREDGTFDLSDITSKAKTEAVNKIKKGIRRQKDSSLPSSKGSNKTSARSLAEYFD